MELVLGSPRQTTITWSNAPQRNVRFYRMDQWRTLGLRAEDDRFSISFDGHEPFSTKGGTFIGPGKVGLWTKADSVTHFDRVAIAFSQ